MGSASIMGQGNNYSICSLSSLAWFIFLPCIPNRSKRRFSSSSQRLGNNKGWGFGSCVRSWQWAWDILLLPNTLMENAGAWFDIYSRRTSKVLWFFVMWHPNHVIITNISGHFNCHWTFQTLACCFIKHLSIQMVCLAKTLDRYHFSFLKHLAQYTL